MPISFFTRLIQVARFNSSVYIEVKDDPSASWQAVVVVAAVAIAHAVLGIFYATRGHWNVLRLIIPSLQSEFIIWFISATVMYLIGTRILKSTVSYRAVLKTLGLAALPGVLYAFGFISEVILIISWLWRLTTILIATQQVFGLGPVKSIILVALGGVVGFLITGYGTITTLQVLEWFGVRQMQI